MNIIIFENIVVIGMYHVQSMIVYLESKIMIESETAGDTLVLSEDEFSIYAINRRELVINGRYFDIKKVYNRNGEIFVDGYWDIKESALMKQLETKLLQDFVKKIIKLFPKLLTPFILVKPTDFIFWKFNCKRSIQISFLLIESAQFLFTLFRPPVS